MSARENRPTEGAVHEIPAKASAPSVTALSREFTDGYEKGFEHGQTAGRQQLEDEWKGRLEVSAAIASAIARMGPADELEERRGRPERAARLRQIMADRGIAG